MSIKSLLYFVIRYRFIVTCLFAVAMTMSLNASVPGCHVPQKDRLHRRGGKALRADEVDAARQRLLLEWKDSVRMAFDGTFKSRMMQIGQDSMQMAWKVYGSNPSDGFALFISLHGGGGTTSAVNNQQWRNQQVLYQPKDAVYLCPRSIKDSWDMHFLPQTDAFYQNIIMMAVAFLHVNPDKVYLMGYSAGGDGVWRLAPRMADSWAAASMMAGHPGDVSLVNLRHLPYMIWCGELDSAYERNQRCRERIAEMDSLHRNAHDGYVFEGHIQKGKGHWMDRTDSVAVSWMTNYRRNPYPKEMVWRQEEVTRPHFYWLSAPADELQRGREVRAFINGNTITITKCDYSSLTISLNDQLLNLDAPVRVIYQGRTLFKGKVKRLMSTLRSTLYTRNDPSYMFPAQIQMMIPVLKP